MSHAENFDVAIIGLAGRFPGAENIEAFWELLKNGREAIIDFSDEELLAAGVNPELLNHPDYVKRGTVLTGTRDFDANFFDMSAKDAEITDPQLRLFMECVWQTLESAGYPPSTVDARIGLYAGIGNNSYLQHHLRDNRQELVETIGEFRLFTLSGKDFVATRTAYKLNLTGPVMTIQTACSTSLVTVHAACQSLLNNECDMALAGGVSIMFPQRRGYLYQEGMISSPDGHCRAFDAKAQGTIGGNGLGVVLLKRLDDALRDGDTIHAVVKGSSINNDGADKISYTAPSVMGQVEVILEAHSVAQVHPDSISYIEAHGTGTYLGDPVEIQALTQAFRSSTPRTGYCAVGSVKTNIGHADTAAGIAGFIKTVLALKHRQIPASLHFESPNPQIDFANSPFFVNTKLCDWETPDGEPLCAAVSSFGIGGTNAHAILAQAPAQKTSSPSRSLQLFTFSTKTSTALELACKNLADWLPQQQNLAIADVSFTLNRGRHNFAHRKILVCDGVEDAVQQLSNPETLPYFVVGEKTANVAFLFPGQGSQYLGMTQDLYHNEAVFKESFDQCADFLTPFLGVDLRDLLYSADAQGQEQLKQTAITQPALFAVEYALAQQWMAWGVQPQAMLGHSIGEYVAACVAGVFTLEEALELVANRGRLLQSLPKGDMLAVLLPETEAMNWCSEEISLAVINGKQRCVFAGTPDAIAQLQNRLQEHGIEGRYLETSHAFHSHLLEPALDEFAVLIQDIDFQPPQIPYLSNFTGTWITDEQATDIDYWIQHLRHTVRFADNLETLFKQKIDILLEVGPSAVLSTLARQHPDFPDNLTVLQTLPPQRQIQPLAECRQLLHTFGQLWQQGASIDWEGFYEDEQRHRIPLPTYPFERKKYWLETSVSKSVDKSPIIKPSTENNPRENWLYRPAWQQTPLANSSAIPAKHWLLFADNDGISQQFQQYLLQQGHRITTVQIASGFQQLAVNSYTVNPNELADYEALIQQLALSDFPTHWGHFWNVTQPIESVEFNPTETLLHNSFYSLFYLSQALRKSSIDQSLEINLVSHQMQAILEADNVQPEKATLLGAIKTLELQMRNISCRSIDITLPFTENAANVLWTELLTPIHEDESIIAYRQEQRWKQTYESLLWQPSTSSNCLRQHGVYLITGGLGGIGLCLAQYLVQQVQAKLILTSRSPFPEKSAWQDWLLQHEKDNPISGQIILIQALEKEGAEVLICRADVTDITQMCEAIEAAQQLFGTIHGVIHAAGVTKLGHQYQVTAEQVLAPKIAGTLLLAQLLENIPLDFFIFCSSLSAIVGFSGQMAYSSANAFLDAFAQAHRYSPTLYLAIDWDGWINLGMAVKADDYRKNKKPSLSLDETEKPESSQYLLPKEGVAAFEQILMHRESQIIVVKKGLASLFKQIKNLFRTPVIPTTFAKAKHSRPTLSKPYIAPRTAIEVKLTEIWQTFFGIEPVGIEDDFFELGGDSLLTIQLVVKLNAEFKVKLDTHFLLQAATIAKLAQLIAAQANTTVAKVTTLSPLLVKFQEGDKNIPPLICLYPVGGHVYHYRELAQQLGSKQPVYAIRALGAEGEAPILTTVEAMAKVSIEALQMLQPHGPYYLAGLSFGGTLVYEIAQRLLEQGEKIAYLGLIDTPGPRHMPIEMSSKAEILFYLLTVGKNITVNLAELKTLDEEQLLSHFLQLSQQEDTQDAHAKLRLSLQIFESNKQAMLNYVPLPYSGKIHFYLAEERDEFNPKTPAYAWIPLAKGGIEIYTVPGNHITMNNMPHVAYLANHMRKVLDQLLS